jgi:nucleoside-diphosphate-sugar epimerase
VLFLTGASGYVGMRVGERLAGRGRRLRCLVLPDDPVDPGNRFPAQVVRGDLRDLDSFAAYGDGVNAIVHAASVMPPAGADHIKDVNVRGTANMIDFARRWEIRRFVYFSAVSAISSPKSAYGASKAEAERLVTESGLDYTVLRPTMVYGPDGAADFRSLVTLVRSMPLLSPVPGSGSARLQPVFIGDLVRAVELVLSTAAATGKTYNVSGGTVVRVRELLERIAAAEGLRRLRISVPLILCRAAAGALRLAVPSSLFSPDALLDLSEDADLDNGRFQVECGYQPLTLDEGFARVFGGGASLR